MRNSTLIIQDCFPIREIRQVKAINKSGGFVQQGVMAILFDVHSYCTTKEIHHVGF